MAKSNNALRLLGPFVLVYVAAFLISLNAVVATKDTDLVYFQQRALLEVTDTDRENAKKFAETQRNAPRYTFFTSGQQLTEIAPGFCAPDANEECQWTEYIESILLVAALGFIVAFLVVIFCPIFWLSRLCCCGGCRASHGCFCPGEPFNSGDGDGYSNKEILILKITTFVLFAVALVCVIVGAIGNQQFGDSVDNTVQIVIDAPTEILNTLSQISSSLQSLQAQGIIQVNVTTQIDDAIAAGNEIVDTADSYRVQVNKYNEIRGGVMIAAFVICAVLFVLPVIGAILSGLNKLTWGMACGGFIGMTFMWITFSIHYPLSILLADICYDIEQAQSQPTQPAIYVNGSIQISYNAASIYALIAQCSSIPAFQEFRNLTQVALDTSAQQGCDGVRQYCNLTLPCQGNPLIPFPYNSTTIDPVMCLASDCAGAGINVNQCNASVVNSFYSTASIADFIVQCPTSVTTNSTTASGTFPPSCSNVPVNTTCTGVPVDGSPYVTPVFVCSNLQVGISSCGTQCQSSDSRDIADTIARAAVGLASLNTLINGLINPLLSCQPVTDAFNELFDELCVNMVSSLFMIVVSSALLGCVFLFGIIAAILATKRFNPENKQLWEGAR